MKKKIRFLTALNPISELPTNVSTMLATMIDAIKRLKTTFGRTHSTRPKKGPSGQNISLELGFLVKFFLWYTGLGCPNKRGGGLFFESQGISAPINNAYIYWFMQKRYVFDFFVTKTLRNTV